ncbi:protoporphyrinogen oxidase [Sulfitobacter sp. SK012]|uniref:flavodoxin domain-containing protein n=1 Tax=Sulfitobacter sp. SK012 TaxID=1389005 RepID=UPI000E0B2C36|nr:flavodoxin domain-containing protein [Sulfitobacter sp. SK012]AXI46634.1 protoporphyrinogen oxidase [Sulfitobacter sp. SK012]
MNIVVLFETGEGQTRKIAEFITSRIRAAGHDVTTVDTSDRMVDLSLESAGKVILAAPVHERRHPKAFEVAVGAAKHELAKLSTLMVSVSLKAAFPESMDEAQDYLTEMEMRTGFEPTQEALVAGAVRTGSYDYYQSQIVRHVALEGHDVELIDGVREFTDWDALAETVDSFLST